MFSFLLGSANASGPRQCQDMRFCSKNIKSSEEISIDPSSVNFLNNEFTATIKDKNIQIYIYELATGGVRFRTNVTTPEDFNRYDLTIDGTSVDTTVLEAHSNEFITKQSDDSQSILESSRVTVTIQYSPFTVSITDGTTEVFLNKGQNLLFEHHTPVPSESFDGLTDPIPHGATAVGLDFSVEWENQAIFSGLSERPGSFELPDTEDEPLRLFNTDGYEYQADQYDNLYGSIPFLMAHSSGHTAACFWMNPSDTFVDISSTANGRRAHFLSEGGYADCVIFVAGFKAIMTQYTKIVGTPLFAPLFAFGYHQSRWGYMSQNEVEIVTRGLDRAGIPFDSIWLDLDHLDSKTPLTFNTQSFSDIFDLIGDLQNDHRYLVRLTDPHFPSNHNNRHYKELRSKNMIVRKSDNSIYQGDAWPGSCVFPDFISPQVRNWWSAQLQYGSSDATAENVYYWNDMNEPSIFKSAESTFPKSVLHAGGFEDREVHNLYGHLNSVATFNGLMTRNPKRDIRPWSLTRSYFAGTQKYSWTWSGDNTASWEHLAFSIPMVLSSGLCGMPFTGADVGGFMKSCDGPLLVRWFQTAAWTYPFFREHCHHKSARREPFLFDDEENAALKKAVIERYTILPVWYTAMMRANETGIPPVRALWTEFDNYHEDSNKEVLLDGSLLVVPVTEDDPEEVEIMLPEEAVWYDFFNGNVETETTIEPEFDKIPVFIRGGKIVPTFSSVGKSTYDTLTRPITLYVALNDDGSAEGDLYLDDGISFDYNEGIFVHRLFNAKSGKITSSLGCAEEYKQYPEILKESIVDTIIIYSKDNGVIKKEGLQLKLIEDWSISF